MASSSSWELRKDGRLLATLSYAGQDMFWTRCRFRHGPAWDDVAEVFARSAAAWAGDDVDAALESDEAIAALNLVLRPGGGGAPVTGFLLRVHGEQAEFRYEGGFPE